MHIAMAGPVLTKPLMQSLENATGLPEGMGGTPVCSLVRDLVDRGQRVSIVTLDRGVTRPFVTNGRLLDLNCGPYRPRHRMRDLMRAERFAVRDGVLRTRADLVHAHWCGEYALGALASGMPTLVTVHDWMPTVLRMTLIRHSPHWFGRTLLYFTTLARARCLTANSPYTAEKVRRFTKAALEVVPNGVPDADFLAPVGLAGAQSMRISGRQVAVSVNRGFGRLKNVVSLLKANRELRRRGVRHELHLIGDGYEPGGPCESWAGTAGLSDGVRFVGPLDHTEVMRRIASATMLVHPSREESFGMTLIEAMSQGTPVIGGARSGAVPWVLAGGRAGLLVDVREPRAIAEAMEAVLTHEALGRRLGHAGHGHAWSHFRQSRVTDLYLDAYRRLLAEVGRR